MSETGVTKERLIAAIKLLNTTVYENEAKDAKVKLVDTNIKFVAVKEDKLKEDFNAACVALIAKLQAGEIPEDAVPNEISDVYNLLNPTPAAEGAAAVEVAEGATEVAGENASGAAAEGAADSKTKKKGKVKSAKAGKSNLPVREKDAFGRVVDSMSGMFSAMLVKGSKLEPIVKAVAAKYGRTEERVEGNLKGHMNKLKKEGFSITEKDEVYTLKAK